VLLVLLVLLLVLLQENDAFAGQASCVGSLLAVRERDPETLPRSVAAARVSFSEAVEAPAELFCGAVAGATVVGCSWAVELRI
jgi:hypothetical protein